MQTCAMTMDESSQALVGLLDELQQSCSFEGEQQPVDSATGMLPADPGHRRFTKGSASGIHLRRRLPTVTETAESAEVDRSQGERHFWNTTADCLRSC